MFQRNQTLRGVDDQDRVSQAIGQLSLCAEGLAELRRAVAGGFEQWAITTRELSATRLPEPTSPVESHREQLESIAGNLALLRSTLAEPPSAPSDGSPNDALNVLRTLAAELKSQRPAVRVTSDEEPVAGAENIPAQITIVNKIPTTLLNVLRQQFQLMEDWLRPLQTNAVQQSADMTRLSETLERCLKEYSQLVGRIETTRKSKS